MSTKSSIITLIVIVALVLIGWWYLASQAPAGSGYNVTPAAQSVESGQSSSVAATPTAANDTSDAALNQDLNAADMQTTNLNADASNVDRGLNDQSVPQGQ